MEYLRNMFKKILYFIKKTVGFPSVDAGNKVDIDGIGTRFSGDPYVNQTSHEIDDANSERNLDTNRTTNVE